MQNPESSENTAWLYIVSGMYISKALSENWGDSIGIQWVLGRHLTWLRPRRRMHSFMRCWGHWGMWHWGLTLFYAISFSVSHMRCVQPSGPSTVNSENCVGNSHRWIPTTGLETPMALLCKGNPWFNSTPIQISFRTIFFLRPHCEQIYQSLSWKLHFVGKMWGACKELDKVEERWRVWKCKDSKLKA